MNQPEDASTFPDILPDSAKMSRIWTYENGDFKANEDISVLLSCMYAHLEDDFYLYCPRNEDVSLDMRHAIKDGVVLITESRAHYYRHPKSKRAYVRIKPEAVEWEWEREVLAFGIMHFRHQLKLSENARRTFEMQQLVAMHKHATSNPMILEPNFMGIGIDLSKAYSWLLRYLKR